LRHCLGRTFASVASLLLNLPIYDTQCGAKLFRNTPELRRILVPPFCSRWIFDVELLARLVAGRRRDADVPARDVIYEMPLSRWKDIGGSKLRPNDFVRAFFDLAVIYWTYLRPGAAGAAADVPRLTLPRPADQVLDGASAELSAVRRASQPAKRDPQPRGKAA
jgi:hypothetical protein